MFCYGYENLKRDLAQLTRSEAIAVGSAGVSTEQRELYMIQMGSGDYRIFLNGAHRATEWITSLILVLLCKELEECAARSATFGGYDAKKLMARCSLTVIPMVNPDGVELIRAHPTLAYLWQANLRGVDLAHNYNAGWAVLRREEQCRGICAPSAAEYGGNAPESESETQRIVALCRRERFDLALCYHTKGQALICNYGDHAFGSTERIIQKLSAASGYRIGTQAQTASGGGCADWIAGELGTPAVTVQTGSETDPFPMPQFPQMYRENRRLLAAAMAE